MITPRIAIIIVSIICEIAARDFNTSSSKNPTSFRSRTQIWPNDEYDELCGLARDDGFVHACLHHLYNMSMQVFRYMRAHMRNRLVFRRAQRGLARYVIATWCCYQQTIPSLLSAKLCALHWPY
jgi:hypothetical protein